MSDCRIVKALELIHQAKTNAEEMGLAVTPALLSQAEDELLRLKVELKRAERHT